MKKKFVGVVLTLVLVFTNVTAVYAVHVETATEFQPFYEETAAFSANFDIEANGTAEICGTLKLLDTSTVDKVYAVVKITNINTDKVVYNKMLTLEYSKIQKRYILSESFELSEKGTYKMNLTYKAMTETRF